MATDTSSTAIMKSYLDLVNEADSFPYAQTQPEIHAQELKKYYHLKVGTRSTTFGYVLPDVARVFRDYTDWVLDDEAKTLTLATGQSEAERSAAVERTFFDMHVKGTFTVIKDKAWRNEKYAVYDRKDGKPELLFNIERSATPLLGLMTYGAHMTAFVDVENTRKTWTPRRSFEKSTFKGMLDNTVGGGLATGESPLDCIVREACEEANLPEELVRNKVKSVGTITYFYIRDDRAGGEIGLLQPECQYVFELDLTGEEGVVCTPNDGEAQSYELLSVEAVMDALHKGEFKPNCAMTLLDFLVRHGILTPANEPDYIEIVQRLHRLMEFPLR